MTQTNEQYLEDIQLRVEKGALSLDDKIPGWHNLIAENTLQLRSGYKCVLGQLGTAISGNQETNFAEVVDIPTRIQFRDGCTYTPDFSNLNLDMESAAHHGFTCHGTGSREEDYKKDCENTDFWQMLNDAWREEILDRWEEDAEDETCDS